MLKESVKIQTCLMQFALQKTSKSDLLSIVKDDKVKNWQLA